MSGWALEKCGTFFQWKWSWWLFRNYIWGIDPCSKTIWLFFLDPQFCLWKKTKMWKEIKRLLFPKESLIEQSVKKFIVKWLNPKFNNIGSKGLLYEIISSIFKASLFFHTNKEHVLPKFDILETDAENLRLGQKICLHMIIIWLYSIFWLGRVTIRYFSFILHLY